MTNYAPADNAAQAIDAIDDGEKVKAEVANRPIKAVADRAEGLKQGLLHVATPGAITAARGITDGIKRLRRVTDLTALAALTMGSTNDDEICAVDDNGALYSYQHSNADTADGVFVINSAAGRWQWVGGALRNTSPGLACTNSAGRLTGPTEVPNQVQEIHTKTTGNALAAEVALSTTGTNQTAFQDPTSDAIFTVSGVKAGDVFDISYTFLADCDGSSRAARGIVALFVGQGTTAELERTLVSCIHDGSNIPAPRQFTISGRFVAVSAVDLTVKIRVATGGTDAAICTIYKPAHARILQKRP